MVQVESERAPRLGAVSGGGEEGQIRKTLRNRVKSIWALNECRG